MIYLSVLTPQPGQYVQHRVSLEGTITGATEDTILRIVIVPETLPTYHPQAGRADIDLEAHKWAAVAYVGNSAFGTHTGERFRMLVVKCSESADESLDEYLANASQHGWPGLSQLSSGCKILVELSVIRDDRKADPFSPSRFLAVKDSDHVTTQPDSILIVTVTKMEAQAVLEVFSKAAGKAWSRQPIGNKTYYNLGVHGGAPVFMVQSEMGTATPGGALLTVRQAIQDLCPQAVIMCGIAFGLRPDKQQLGDILVAKQLLYYEPQKVDLQRGQMPRGDRTTSAERLLDRFRSGDNDWQGVPTHFGLILSGEKLVNDPAFRDWLLKTEPEAVGGEMEGAGLYAAAREAKVDWILVKAICDWADGTKNNDAQPLAARNAAEFVLYVLQLGGWGGPEQLPDHKHSDHQGRPQKLRELIARHFNDSELRSLCFDLHIDYDTLPGESKSDKCRELIAYYERHGQTSNLITELRQQRPNVSWSEAEI